MMTMNLTFAADKTNKITTRQKKVEKQGIEYSDIFKSTSLELLYNKYNIVRCSSQAAPAHLP
jgi:hypothetical protein